MSSESIGSIGVEGKVLIIRRIRVVYHLKLRIDQREAAERAHALHKDACPVALTLKNCVDITTELQMEELPDEVKS